MAADQFSALSFILAKDQIVTDSTLSMREWIDTVIQEKEVHFGFLLSSLICTILTIGISILQFYHVFRFVSVVRLKNNMYYLILLNPISVGCCFFGMISPRNSAFMYGVILSYHMLALRISLDVMFNINGGRVTLSRHLMANNERLTFTFFPFCLFKIFMPSFAPTVSNMDRFEMIVSQTCIVRIVLMIIDICVYREIGTLSNGWFLLSHSISVISTCIALYTSYALSAVHEENSKKFRFNYLFMMVDWSQTLITFQKTGLDVLSALKLFPSFLFPQNLLNLHFSESIYLLFFLFSIEVLIMSALISFVLYPSKSYIFDKYAGSRSFPPPKYMYLDDSDEGLVPSSLDNSPHPNKSIPREKSKSEKSNSQRSGKEKSEDKIGESSAPGKSPVPQPMRGRVGATNKAAIPDDGEYEDFNKKSKTSLQKVLDDELKEMSLPSQGGRGERN